MPIEVDSEIQILSQKEFHELAERVIGIVFGVHNDFGRLLDEELYKQAIRWRCEAAGISPAQREVQITVTHGDFKKRYFMDLLLAGGLMIETKTAEQLTKAHHAQTLHYLFLAGMQHGLLINLRPDKVEKQFVSTSLDHHERRRYQILDSDWRDIDEPSVKLRALFGELLDDWGAFLQTSLYREAIIYFFGGPEQALTNVPIRDDDHQLGTQETLLISENVAMALTALKSGQQAMSDHLTRFLSHSNLSHMQWINMDNHKIEFRTLSK